MLSAVALLGNKHDHDIVNLDHIKQQLAWLLTSSGLFFYRVKTFLHSIYKHFLWSHSTFNNSFSILRVVNMLKILIVIDLIDGIEERMNERIVLLD